MRVFFFVPMSRIHLVKGCGAMGVVERRVVCGVWRSRSKGAGEQDGNKGGGREGRLVVRE